MKIVIIFLVAVLVCLCAYSVTAEERIDRTPVREFDLNRYVGTWYEIARYDHRFERGLDAVQAHYSLLPNGDIAVENRGADLGTGKQKVAHGKAYASKLPGQLRVSFFWFFYSDYNVLELGEHYDWSLVGSSSSKYLWILSRTPTLPAVTLNRILRLAEKRGYNTGKLLYVEQR